MRSAFTFAATAAACIILILECPAAEPVTETYQKVTRAIENRRYDEAIAELTRLEDENTDLFVANNFDYLLGRLYEWSGDPASALRRYSAVVARRTVLSEFALRRSASIARSTGNLFAERIYLRELETLSEDRYISEYAAIRLARSTFESGDHTRAEVLLDGMRSPSGTKMFDRSDKGTVERENKLLLARARLYTGKIDAGIPLLRSLIETSSDRSLPDDVTLAAIRELDSVEFEGGGPQGASSLSDQEHLQRAASYQFNREFRRARLHLEALIRDHSNSPLVPQAIFRTGQTLSQEASFSEAIRWFERLLEQYPDNEFAPDALLQAAAAYSRVGKSRESVRRYQEFISRFPEHPRLDRAYLNIVDVMRDSAEETEALKWAARAQDRFRGKVAEAQATFAEARIHIARNNWDEALGSLDRLASMPDLGGAAVPGGTSRLEISFLRGFVLEQKREFAEAVEVYLAIPDGRNEYYGWRATERLRSLSENEQAGPAIVAKLGKLVAESSGRDPNLNRQNLQAGIRLSTNKELRARLLGSLRRAYSSIPAYRKVPGFVLKLPKARNVISQIPIGGSKSSSGTALSELLFLMLFDEAATRFEAQRETSDSRSADLNYTIAWLNSRGDRAFRSIPFAETVWKELPADYQIELIPSDSRELLYPVPFAETFTRYASGTSTDAHLLLAIGRQESGFRPEVRSSAAARGMMQFISTTSDKIAAELGRPDLDRELLYDPSTAILFSARYTANLFRLFPNQPAAVVASYNGGEDNMRRWLNRSRSDLAERYVPEIAFAQTKDYVYKVMSNYRLYRLFYDDGLAPVP